MKKNVNMNNTIEIQKWVENNNYTRLPSSTSGDDDERRLGLAYKYIKYQLIMRYEKMDSEEERKKFERRHPYIENITDTIGEIEEKVQINIQIDIIREYISELSRVKEWIKDTGFDKRLALGSKDHEVKKQAKQFYDIKLGFYKMYNKWSDKQKEEYMRRFSEIGNLIEDIAEIDKLNVSGFLYNARKIKEWSRNFGDNKPPKQTLNDEEQSDWADKLHGIRSDLINPYYKLETDEERAQYIKKHPDLKEIIKIVEEMDENIVSPYLVNARNIKQWAEENHRLPRRTSNDEREVELAIQLKSIRYCYVTPYLVLDKKGQDEFGEKNPEIGEVLEIVSNLDIEYGTKRKSILAKMIIEDLKRDRELGEARILEGEYRRFFKNRKEKGEQK